MAQGDRVRFSERYGYKPARDVIQIESMDERLRNGLWNVLQVHCWRHVHRSQTHPRGYFLSGYENKTMQSLCQRLWLDYFKKPLDELSDDWREVFPQRRHYFLSCAWYQAYDFLEFVAKNYRGSEFREPFVKSCNETLERELSAYRFVEGLVTRITDEQEIAEVEQAIGEASPGPVSKHLRRSLELFSDRSAPDYRNSIKESICAVESLVAITLKCEKGTLGQLLKKLEERISLHAALKEAFSNLYGYTSDEGGIRHALMGAEKVDFNDAKFMLVACSAFISFVRGKLQNEG